SCTWVTESFVTQRAVEATSTSSLIVMSPSSSSRSSRPSTDLGTSSTPMSETTESKAMYRQIIQDFPVASRIISEIIGAKAPPMRSEEHTSELQSRFDL